MKNSFHYQLLANQAGMQRKLMEKLSGTGLTTGQPKILDYLKDHDGANQKEIAAACMIEPGTLTSVLGRMEEKGIIERRMLNGNRRSLYVFMTDCGKKLAQQIDSSFREIEEAVFAGVAEEDKEIFDKVFRQIFLNMQKEG